MFLHVDDPENPGTKISAIPADHRFIDSKIQLIKAVRGVTGLGLKDSKTMVDRWFAEMDEYMWTERAVADRVNRLVSLDKKLELLNEWKSRQPTVLDYDWSESDWADDGVLDYEDEDH